MTRPDLTDISLVLDRSGSMGAVQEATIAGFNQFLAEQRKLDGEARLSLVQFDHEYEPVFEATPLNDVPELDANRYVPRGRTALLDAIGLTIDRTGQRLASQAEPDRPGQVLFVILTDGHENSSHRYTADQIFQMIEHQQDVCQWQFIYLGANQDAIATAASYGIGAGHAMTYDATPAASGRAWGSLSSSTARYRGRRNAPSGEPDFFTDEERRASRSDGGR